MEFDNDVILGLNVLDLIIVALLMIFVLHGFSRGIGRTIGGAAGLVLGVILALWLLPHVEITAMQRWIRLGVVAIVLLLCMLIGQTLGERLFGRVVGTPPRKSSALTVVDRTGGGVIGAAIATVVVLSLSGLLNQVPLPWLNAQLEGSRTLVLMQRWTPQGLTEALAVTQDEIAGAPAMRELDELLFPSVEPPRTDVDDPEVMKASASTVHVLGTAARCGYNQSGSGFVTDGGYVVTNAHVVQGTDSVAVFTPQGQRHSAEVVHFVPEYDLAVLNAPDVDLEPLTTTPTARFAEGTNAAFMGYPLSGPLTVEPATVQGSAYTVMGSMDGSEPVQVLQFAGDVQQGNSGGPLVDMDGHVIGVVFGKAADEPAGYAVNTTTLEGVLADSSGATEPVDTGGCQKS
ncbi:MAG: MarP family serine protease [Kocuria sp.]|nr:MarP family serine protease [Kocuria sp.]